MARQHYGSGNVSSHGDFFSEQAGDESGKDFISGHFGFNFARPHLGARYSFTFLRDPIDRLISLYNFCNTRPDDSFPIYRAARRLSFEDFIAYGCDKPVSAGDIDHLICRETIRNNQVWQLAHGWGADKNSKGRVSVLDFRNDELLSLAKRNLEAFDHVGTVEAFDNAAPVILKALGIEHDGLARENVGTGSVRREELAPSTLAALAYATELDAELYALAASLAAARTPL